VNNQHQNARTTFHSRVTIVQRGNAQKMHPRPVAEQFDVSVGTVYKWLRRFAQDGEAALRDRSSRPHRSPRRLAVQRVATIAALRRMRLSSLEIAFALSAPVSSVSNELRRLGLDRL